MKHTLPICGIILSAFCFSGKASADKVDRYIDREMKTRAIPGLTLMVIQDGKPVKTAAYGLANLELNSPTKIDSAFEIGSVTKQFTGASILLLAQDGKLSIDDPIAKHFSDIPPEWNSITIRHLLHHTSGIKSYTGLNGFELTKRLSQKEFLEKLRPLPLEFEPGERYKYSNSGYSLLGYIIENVSGKDYWTFLGERIFAPLNMTSSTNREPSIIIPNRANGYEMRKNGERINRDYDLTDIFSAGAIVSTIGDLAKWNAALDSETLLTKSSKEQMWTSGTLNDGKEHGYGLGWRVEPYKSRRNVGHSGSTSGFSASLQKFPDDDLAVIVLCNSGELNVATVLARSIAELFFEK